MLPLQAGAIGVTPLTGIPNMLTAMRLALHGRGSAVVSEALNSNTLNLLSGTFLPIAILGMGIISASTLFELWWLLGLTLCVVILASFRGGLSRWNGVGVIGLYLLLAVIQLIFSR